MHRVNILYERIEKNIPFAFIKINDGECAIINNSDSNVIASRGDQHSSELLSQKLKESLDYSHPNYFVGLPCTQCHNYDMTKYSGDNFLNANILINSNTNSTIELLSKSLANKYVVVITNRNLIQNIHMLQMLNINVNKTIEVSAQNAFDNDYDRIRDMWQTIPHGAYVICLCGPLGRVICYEWFKSNDKLFCLELGSLFDPLLKGRSYSYHQNTLRLCTECNPTKLTRRAFDELIPNYELLETECFYFNDLDSYINFYGGDLGQIRDVLFFRSKKNDQYAIQMLKELDNYKNNSNANNNIQIIVNYSDISFQVFYGVDSYNVDVTSIFVSHFAKNNRKTNFVISAGKNFNSVFGDPRPGTVKYVYLIVDDLEIIIDENYKFENLEIILNKNNRNNTQVFCTNADMKIDLTKSFMNCKCIRVSNINQNAVSKSIENIAVKYGCDMIRKTVTKKFIEKFVIGNNISIPNRISFNDCFGDVCVGIAKNLIIETDNAVYEINESRVNSIRI